MFNTSQKTYGEYEFYTYNRTQGDPIMEIYQNKIKLYSDDDSAGDLNPSITAEMKAGEVFYIYLRSYSYDVVSRFFIQARLSTSST